MLNKLYLLIVVVLFFSAAALASPRPGNAAPGFSLPDQDGKQVALEDFKGRILVLEWLNPECPFVKRHYKAGTMKKLADKYSAKNVTWVAINSTHFIDSAANKAFIKKHELSYPILNDQSGEVGKAYGAKTTPHMVIVDAKGEIAYDGAIDSDKWGEAENPTNYVDVALNELTAGKAVSIAETTPYGCSVKYKG